MNKKVVDIVVVDDHQIFIDGMTSLLKELDNVRVVGTATAGKSAVALAKEVRPDLFLMDIQMPEMDGIEATKRIIEFDGEIKVIALTMMDESNYIRRCLEAGASGYILKSADHEELVKAINKVMTGQSYYTSEVTHKLLDSISGSINSDAEPLNLLTQREREVLSLIAEGLTDKEIGEKIYLSYLTVITHRKNILSKLGLKNKVELTRFAIENGLTE